jgi:CopA family copper-resistance protein
VVLSDWTFAHPHRVFSKLKKVSESYNYQQRTLGDFFKEAQTRGLGATLSDRAAWGAMRMSPTDISDVTGATYTFLINGQGPKDNWTGLFTPGERVRLRFINAGAMTIFNVRIPGLPMTVVQSDGLNVQPIEIDEFQIGNAETYDVIVQPTEDKAFSLIAEAIDRSGYGRATLAPRAGMETDIPPMRSRPTLTMKDMGMDHDMDHGAIDGSQMDRSQMDHSQMDHSQMDHGDGAAPMKDMDMGSMNMSGDMQDHRHPTGPGVVNTAMSPTSRLGEAGAGLQGMPHRVLRYTDLRSLAANPDQRAPEREIELHLTSNMQRYMWSFDGVKFSEVEGPIIFRKGERVRMTLVNDSMMPHPTHLHGMFFDVINGETTHKPRKHTIIVKPGEKLSVDVTADEVGDWALHCHLIYHMHSGMFRVVSVREEGSGA